MSDLAEQAVTQLLTELGADLTEDGLRETPRRVACAIREMLVGYQQDPAEILAKDFEASYDQMVILQGVRFQSLCEHHLMPFTGVAHVGYLPKKRVVGLSKLARLVNCFARRLQLQERMTQEIARAIEDHLDALGVGVVVRASHACMAHRGAMQPDAEMVTSAMFGRLRDNNSARMEFLRLVGGA